MKKQLYSSEIYRSDNLAKYYICNIWIIYIYIYIYIIYIYNIICYVYYVYIIYCIIYNILYILYIIYYIYFIYNIGGFEKLFIKATCLKWKGFSLRD